MRWSGRERRGRGRGTYGQKEKGREGGREGGRVCEKIEIRHRGRDGT